MRTFWLSLHLGYRCRDSGACCSSAWDIPVEKARVRRIAFLRSDPSWLRVVPNAPCDVAGVLAVADGGRCVFHQADAPRRGCEIQHAFGHEAIPGACQHFPRECLIDRRGVFVTLSNYCPTAADLLFTCRAPVRIVEAAVPEGVSARESAARTYEGLDARDALPPSLTSAMLMDDDGFAAWEAHTIARLAGDAVTADVTAEECLERLVADARALVEWQPGAVTLCEAIALLPPRTERPSPAVRSADWPHDLALFEVARSAVPVRHAWPSAPPDVPLVWDRFIATLWPASAPVVRRFLATHAFAPWMAYQGNGLLTLVRRLQLALAVLKIELARAAGRNQREVDRATLTEAIRQTDLLVVHLADRGGLARRLSAFPA